MYNLEDHKSPRGFNLGALGGTQDPEERTKKVLKAIRTCIEKECMGNLFIGGRPKEILELHGAVLLLKETKADESVYRSLKKIWDSPFIGWSPQHEELAKILNVDWSRVQSKNREEWTEPLSYLIYRGGGKT